MNLFGQDFSVEGDYASASQTGVLEYNPQLPEFEQRMFGTIDTAPMGEYDIAYRSNTSFWDFDQSKITAGIYDVINSGIEAGGRLAIQSASDAINSGTKSSNPWLSGFSQNFQSTKTGAQINAASYATKVQNFFANPIVWFSAAALALVLLFRR